MSIPSRAHLSGSTLVRQAFEHIARESGMTAEHLADLAEIDACQHYRPESFHSMQDFCIRGLRLTEDEANLRIRIARKGRQYPALFEAIADGRLRLTAVDLMASRLAPENVGELIAAATHRTIAELREILAARFPKPDVPERIEALSAPDPVVPEMSGEVGSNPPAGSDRVELAMCALPEPPAGPRSKVEPLSAQRFGLQCTIGRGTYEKLQYVKSLLGHGVPSGDLAAVLDRALDSLARELERRKYGITDRPRSRTPRKSTNPRHIPAEVKRAVVARDGGQCTFTSDSGRRCEARDRLEFDHVEPVARGGGATVGNIRLRCRAHNQLEAERTYGADFVRHKRAAAREAAGARRREKEERAKAATAAQARADEERDRVDAAAVARKRAADEVIPWLRGLGLRKDEARAAATVCESIPDAPLEARVKLALRSCAKPAPVRVASVWHPAG